MLGMIHNQGARRLSLVRISSLIKRVVLCVVCVKFELSKDEYKKALSAFRLMTKKAPEITKIDTNITTSFHFA